MAEKIKTIYPGVRYREYPDKKYNGHPERCFFIRYTKDGRKVEETAGWRSEETTALEASKIRAQIVHNIRTGLGPQSLAEMRQEKTRQAKQEHESLHLERQEQVTFRDAAAAFESWAKDNKKSWRDDTCRLQHILPIIGDIRLVDLDKEHARELATALKNKTGKNGAPLAPATIRHCLTLARRIINHASDTVLPGSRTAMFAKDNPFRRIKMPKVDNQRWRYLTFEEAQELLQAFKKPYPPAQIYSQAKADRMLLICRLALYTGARLSEITCLRLEDLFISSNMLRLVDTKHGSRTVYPDEETLAMLQEQTQGLKGTWAFPSRVHSSPACKYHIGHVFTRTIKDKTRLNQGIQDARNKITFHTLRHTFGTWQIYGGMDIETLSRLMGHTDLSTTRRYVHLAEDFKAQMAARSRIEGLRLKPF